MKALIALALGLALASCAQWQAEREAAQDAADDAQCLSYGAKANDPAYTECRMRLAEQRAANQRAATAALLANRPAPYYLPPPAPPPAFVNTTCNTLGNTTNCVSR